MFMFNSKNIFFGDLVCDLDVTWYKISAIRPGAQDINPFFV